MLQENVEAANVEFVLDGYARFNAGERVPELWFFTPDAEYTLPVKTPTPRSIADSTPSGVNTPAGSSHTPI